MLANHKKGIFPLKRAFLGESISIKFQVLGQRDINSFTYVILHYKIRDFLCTVLLVPNTFQSEVFHLSAAMKTQRFADI